MALQLRLVSRFSLRRASLIVRLFGHLDIAPTVNPREERDAKDILVKDDRLDLLKRMRREGATRRRKYILVEVAKHFIHCDADFGLK